MGAMSHMHVECDSLSDANAALASLRRGQLEDPAVLSLL
jgi:hypothetical protein